MEMLCIMKGDFAGKDVQIYYQDIYMHVWMDSEESILKMVQNVGRNRPLEIGSFVFIKQIYDSHDFLTQIQDSISLIPTQKFTDCINYYLPMTLGDL
jgi:hypothetical protein